eukprot:2320947-Prorocentrum_lima.AAC.1
MHLHINGTNQMNLVTGTTKTPKDMMMKMQAVKKRAIGLNQKLTGMQLMAVPCKLKSYQQQKH